MGGTPRFALVTLCLPGDFHVEDAVELYQGLRECCDAYGVVLGGGDIVRSSEFAVTVALSGAAAVDAGGQPVVLTRGAARPGDAVAVTANLGDSAAGLRLLRSGADRSEPGVATLIEAHENPRPRVDAGQRAVGAGIRCGMDISDGLLQDAGHIARAADLRIEIDSASVPLGPETRALFPADALELALTGGEDYQLLLCGPRATFERLIVEGLDLTLIGEAVAGTPGVTVRDLSGREAAYGAGGWDHFRGSGA